MGDYEIGRDLQELRSRVERLEGLLGEHRAPSIMRGKGRVERLGISPGVELHKEPTVWKTERGMAVPPFFNAILGLSPGLKLDSAQSKSWTCQPEPLILNVNWDAGGSDEFYRLHSQLFSLFRATDPNTGITTCSVFFDATLAASGKAASHGLHPGALDGILGALYFNITLANNLGGSLHYQAGSPYWVNCHDNRAFSAVYNVNPGLYDIVAGATWQISGQGFVDRC
jgi:hypothetical protein